MTASAQRPLPPGPGRRLPFARLLEFHRKGMLQVLVDLSARYGDFVSFNVGRPMCLVTDPDVIRQVLVTDAARFTKSHILAGAKATLGEGLLTSDGELHKTQRRLIGPAFHAQKIKAYADDFVAQAERLSSSWKDGQTVDLNAAMTELTLRVVTRSLFGTELEDDIAPVGRDMHTIVGMFERVRNPLGFLLDRLPLPSNRRFIAAVGRLDDRIAGMIRQRRESSDATNERFDFLSLLLSMGDGTMSERQVRDEAVTLFMAGHETTANALIWTWLLLAENPQAAAALHAELDAVLGDRRATADDMPKLKYTRAVIAESMRLRPPAWIVARLCAEPYAVGPYQLPAGTTILLPQYVVHRDPRWWPEAEAFRPDRWLDDAPAALQRERPKYAYFPFGGGPRSCVGEPFAWMEAVLLLATMAQRWTLSRVDDQPVRLFATITLRPKDAVRMTVHARGPISAG